MNNWCELAANGVNMLPEDNRCCSVADDFGAEFYSRFYAILAQGTWTKAP